jgi:hypothetical protein
MCVISPEVKLTRPPKHTVELSMPLGVPWIYLSPIRAASLISAKVQVGVFVRRIQVAIATLREALDPSPALIGALISIENR